MGAVVLLPRRWRPQGVHLWLSRVTVLAGLVASGCRRHEQPAVSRSVSTPVAVAVARDAGNPHVRRDVPATRVADAPVRLTPVAVRASTELADGRLTHAARLAFDGQASTAWNEGAAGPGAGEWIEADLGTAHRVRRVRITTGWDHTTRGGVDLFAANAHLRRVRLVFDDGTSLVREAAVDQRVLAVDLDVLTRRVRIVADEVWPGLRYQDLCLSEVALEGALPPLRAGQQRVQLGEDPPCLLRAVAGVVTAECARGALTCTAVARGDLAPVSGDEVVFRCEDRERVHRVLAIANGPSVLWAYRINDAPDGSGAVLDSDCAIAPRVAVEVVDAVEDTPREMLMHVTGCEGTDFVDRDVLWKWRGDRMQLVARATFGCQTTADTGDPEREAPPEDELWACEGGYLDVGGAAQGWTITEDTLEFARIRGDRGRNGRVVTPPGGPRRTLRWDPGTFRFQP